jgi:hypothetical protein
MATLFLGRDSYKIEVSKEGYQQILAIVKETAVCSSCEEHYSNENSNVAGLLCLHCFLQQHSRFTFIGPLDESLTYHRSISPHDPFPSPAYLFLDDKGHAYVTEAGPGHSEKPSENSSRTLQYWHFPVPTEANIKGEMKDVRDYSWYIYGDIANDDVILIQHGDKVYKNEILFIVRRHKQGIQLNPRSSKDRQILKSAREEIESTRNNSGDFWIDREWKSWIQESDIYTLASRQMSEEARKKEHELKTVQQELITE